MDTDDWSAWLRQRQAARRLEAVARIQDELAQVHAEAVAAGGLVQVRVTAAGRPTALHLAARATVCRPTELAAP